MNIDDLKDQWAELDRKIETSIHLSVAAVRGSALDRASVALSRLARGVWIELAITAVLLIALGSFLYDHWTAPRFFIAALVLHIVTIALAGACVHQLVALNDINYGAPVVAIQKKLSSIRIARIRITKWTLFAGPLLWVPALIVMLKGLLGVDAYAIFDAAWLAANVVFGAAFIPLTLWLYRRFAQRFGERSWMKLLMDDVAGKSLSEATRFLDEVTRFETEPQ